MTYWGVMGIVTMFFKQQFTLFSHKGSASSMLGVSLGLTLILSLLLGGFPYYFLVGASFYFVFFCAWSVWFISFWGSLVLKLRVFNKSSLMSVFLYLFDGFVTLLRPVTLTLRVFINVSLGHFLMESVCLSGWGYLYIILLVECFVYIVQSFVFLTLALSYTETLY